MGSGVAAAQWPLEPLGGVRIPAPQLALKALTAMYLTCNQENPVRLWMRAYGL